MKIFFQTLLGLLFVVVGFLGTWAGILTWTTWTHPWVTGLACLVIGFACYLSAQEHKSRWLRFPALGLLAGSALLGATLSYARPMPLLCFGMVVFLLGALSVSVKSLRKIAKGFVCLLALSWLTFAADHLFLSGQVFAWKWRVIEDPLFGPGGFIREESHGRRVIYALDVGFIKPWCVATIWGWHVFPQEVSFGVELPDGELLKDPKIQEAIR